MLELGAELISSDAIAIYELVKNAFDAGSPSVSVDVRVVLRRSAYERIVDALGDGRLETAGDALDEVREAIDDGIDAGLAAAFLDDLDADGDVAEFEAALETAYLEHNYINISDRGSGMSLDKLRTAFLTIGTANRITGGRTRDDGRRMLGEKGVGRLSAMRLGSRLNVRTARRQDSNWAVLDIDWNDFSSDPDLMIEVVAVAARPGEMKRDPGRHGTVLTIRDVASDWSQKSLRELTASEFSRLVDPFQPPGERFAIEVRFNDEPVGIDRISSALFKNCHGYCKGTYDLETDTAPNGHAVDTPRLTATFEYRLYNERQDFDLGPSELRDSIGQDVPERALIDLGPFEFEFYWYNRRLLTGMDGVGKLADVRKLVNTWSGGLMLFRDGFRVNPYGSTGDDWLDLNSQAFKASGYLLNTDQIIGRVLISGADNPRLVDQTNREGLRDTFEQTALTRILHQFLTVHLKGWMDGVNDAYAGLKQIDLNQIEANVERYDKRVETNLKELRTRFPGETVMVEQLVESFGDMKLAFDRAKAVADKSTNDKQRMVELAGVGLMVEVVAHELARATKHTLDLLRSSQNRSDVPLSVRPLFENLEAQLSTIEHRLRVLDPLSVAGRQRRVEFDLVEAVRNSFEARADELARLGVRWTVARADGSKSA